MLSAILNVIHNRTARARTACELRRFHDAELREIGVSGEEIEAFLGGRI